MNKIVNDVNSEKRKEFKKLAEAFVDYLYKYGTPHTTILITQCGAEQLEGEVAVQFDLRD